MACISYLMGDVNGDGIVDQDDADLLFNWVAFPNERDTTYKLTCPENGDVTGNGSINIGDAVLLQNHVLHPNDPAYALAQPSSIVIPGEYYDLPIDPDIDPEPDVDEQPQDEGYGSILYIILAIIIGVAAIAMG